MSQQTIISKIKDSLNSDEKLHSAVFFNQTAIVFCIIERGDKITPYAVKGYDSDREEFYSKFWCCTDYEASILMFKQFIGMLKAAGFAPIIYQNIE